MIALLQFARLLIFLQFFFILNNLVVQADRSTFESWRIDSKPHGAASFFVRSLERQEETYTGRRIHGESMFSGKHIFRRRWGASNGIFGSSSSNNNDADDSRRRASEPRVIEPDSLEFFVRVGLAGGFGGAMGTAVLYPTDSAKTLRQSNPDRYRSVGHALKCLLVTTRHSVSSAVATSTQRQWHPRRAYAGLLPSVVGAIPSSALYFGAYEGMKHVIQKYCPFAQNGAQNDTRVRLCIHALSAASGNVLSSAIFVPKEAIKQQMQYHQTSNIGKVTATIIRSRGIQGLYSGYRATLMRNIPSAMLRFAIYEELKYRWVSNRAKTSSASKWKLFSASEDHSVFSWKLFLAGAAAGSLASGLMTPVDVIKTRVSTGTCPINLQGCANQILAEQGWKGFYLGAGSRMLWSGAFSSIGFGSFEAAKKWLGVSEQH